MTLRELKVRYKNTSLGFVWVIVYPVIQALIIGYIFQFLYVVSDETYKYSLFLNLLIWNFFSTSLESATPSIVRSRSIIKKAKFPYVVIPLSIVLCNGIHFIFSLSIFSIFVKVFNISGSFNFIYLLLGTVLLLIFTSSLSLITSSLNVKVRDISFLNRAVLMIWFYATPIVYDITKIPSQIKYLWNLNPLTEINMFFQTSLFNSNTDVTFIFANTTIILMLLVTSILIFRKYESSFGDYI